MDLAKRWSTLAVLAATAGLLGRALERGRTLANSEQYRACKVIYKAVSRKLLKNRLVQMRKSMIARR